MDGSAPVTQYGYDENRNEISQTDANNHVVTMAYDDLNRLTTYTQNLGGRQLVTQHQYDFDGNETLLVDPKRQHVTNTYDELNRLKTKTYAGDSAALWRHTTGVAHTYDANGNLRQADESIAGTTIQPSTLTTMRVYDNLDRLTSETQPLADVDSGTRTVGYTYFANGTRKTVTDPGGAVTGYTYDGQNRFVTATIGFGTQQASTTTYDYFC